MFVFCKEVKCVMIIVFIELFWIVDLDVLKLFLVVVFVGVYFFINEKIRFLVEREGEYVSFFRFVLRFRFLYLYVFL